MDAKELLEAAEGGAICEVCGGLHVPDIETAIIVSAAEERVGKEIPTCDCACDLCAPFKKTVEALVAEEEQQ